MSLVKGVASMAIWNLGWKLRVAVARLVVRPAWRIAEWSSETMRIIEIHRAYEAFPIGSVVRVVSNGCCHAAAVAENQDGLWVVDYFTDHGDFRLTRSADSTKHIYVHATAMQRAMN